MHIPGVYLIHDFISAQEEEQLAVVDVRPWHNLAKRMVQNYGYEFCYNIPVLQSIPPSPARIPPHSPPGTGLDLMLVTAGLSGGGTFMSRRKRELLSPSGGSFFLKLMPLKCCVITKRHWMKYQETAMKPYYFDYCQDYCQNMHVSGLSLVKYQIILNSTFGAQGNREAEVFQVSNDDAAVAQRRFKDKQLEEKTNMNCLVKEQEKVHLSIKVRANIMVTGVSGQEGA
ncbi:hypothetical protein Tco_0796974 [Tanacetum coccineum]